MSNANDFEIKRGILKKYTGSADVVVIPEKVVEIGEGAFRHCHELTKIVIPEGVKKIRDHAFRECWKLCEITLPSTLEFIGNGAFMLCALSEIEIPDGVITIDDHAFSENEIKRITISQSVKTIGTRAFNYIGDMWMPKSGLEEVTVLSDALKIGTKAFPQDDGVRFYAPNAALSCFPTENKRQIITTYLTGEKEYSPKRVEDYKKYINRTDDLIGLYMETSNTQALGKLLQIKTKVNLEKIDGYINDAGENAEIKGLLIAFKEKVFKSEDIEKIVNRKMDIELGVKKRSVAEWKQLFALEKVDGGLMITSYKGEDEIVEVPEEIGGEKIVAIGDEAFSPYKSRIKNAAARRKIREVILPNTIETIGKSAFESCDSLECMIIPDGVKKIDYRAFLRCSRLTKLQIPASAKTIQEDVFSYSENLTVYAPSRCRGANLAKKKKITVVVI